MSHPSFEPGQKPDGSGPVYYAEPPQKSRGCFFYGCIAALIVSGLGLLLVIAAVGMLWYYANRLIHEYTETAPAAIPTVTASEEQKKAVTERWAEFKKAVDEGKQAELVLTAEDVNILIEQEPQLKGKVFCEIKGEEVTGQISIPLGESGIPGLGGRYLNGKATFTAEVDDTGELDIRAHDIEVKGKKLPPEAKAQLGGENLAKEFIKNPENRRMIRKIKRIKIHDDKVFITSRDMSKEKDEDDSKEAPKGESQPDGEPAKVKSTPDPTKPAPEKSKTEAPKPEPVKAEAPKGDTPKPEPEPAKAAAPKSDTPKPEPAKAGLVQFRGAWRSRQVA